jgi:hypothetical protein
MVDAGRRVGRCARRRAGVGARLAVCCERFGVRPRPGCRLRLAVGEREQHDPLDSPEPIPDSLMAIAGLGERVAAVARSSGWPGWSSRL